MKREPTEVAIESLWTERMDSEVLLCRIVHIDSNVFEDMLCYFIDNTMSNVLIVFYSNL